MPYTVINLGGIAVGCGGLLALAVVLFVIGALASSGSDSKPRTTAGNTAPTAPSTAAAAPVEAPTPSVKPEKPAEQPAADEYGDGDYIVGEDIPPGTYTTPGAEAGVFELCIVTTKPTDDSVMPQLKSANRGDRIIITLKKEDGVVSVSGCEPLKLRK